MSYTRFLGYILIFLFLMATVIPSYAADPPLPTPIGRVVWVKGIFKAIMPNKEERTLQKSSVIYLHDTLITSSDSQAQIIFTDNSMMTFRAETKFYIEQYEYNPQSKGSVGKYLMNLIEGGFRTITGIIAKKSPNAYQINTPVATIGVRGTDYVLYFNRGQMFIGYNSGTPCVSSQNRKSTLCLSASNRYAYVPSAGAAPIPLAQRPAVFQEKLDVVPAQISPFGGSSKTPSGKSGTGVISNFCITQ